MELEGSAEKPCGQGLTARCPPSHPLPAEGPQGSCSCLSGSGSMISMRGDGNVVLSDAHSHLWPQIFLSHPLPLLLPWQ